LTFSELFSISAADTKKEQKLERKCLKNDQRTTERKRDKEKR
jgi:hypothetical protein